MNSNYLALSTTPNSKFLNWVLGISLLILGLCLPVPLSISLIPSVFGALSLYCFYRTSNTNNPINNTTDNFPIASNDPELAIYSLSEQDSATETMPLLTMPYMICQTTPCYGSVPIRDITPNNTSVSHNKPSAS